MFPSVHLAGLELTSHVILLVLAVATVHWLGPRWANRREGLDPWRTWYVLLWLGLAAFAGGRIHFVANTWFLATYRSDPLEAIRFWQGLHAGGAIVALLVATPIVLRLHRIPIGQFLDAVAPAMLVGVAVARVGCFLNGCCFGTVCHGPLCVPFPPGSPVQGFHEAAGLIADPTAWSAPVHPLPLYFAALALAASASARWLYPNKRYDGRVMLISMTTYLVGAAILELVRADYYPAGYRWAGTLQFLWIATILAGTAVSMLTIAELADRGGRFRSRTRDTSLLKLRAHE